MGLRITEGVLLKPDKETLEPFIRRKIGEGLLEEKNGNIRLTGDGWLWYNRIVSELFGFLDGAKG